jgi:uncharacterized protein YfaS (alpha-2-macroglobulin family)
VVEAKRDDRGAQRAGIAVSREYLDGHGNAVDKIAVGSIVTVRLTVTVDAEHRWIALVDPLPAGLEAMNTRLAATIDTRPNAPPTGTTGPSSWSWDFQELRDDEVRWFADQLPKGTYVLSYQARATVDGTFVAPSAHAEAMYDPSVVGRTAAGSFTVTR